VLREIDALAILRATSWSRSKEELNNALENIFWSYKLDFLPSCTIKNKKGRLWIQNKETEAKIELSEEDIIMQKHLHYFG